MVDGRSFGCAICDRSTTKSETHFSFLFGQRVLSVSCIGFFVPFSFLFPTCSVCPNAQLPKTSCKETAFDVDTKKDTREFTDVYYEANINTDYETGFDFD